MREETSDKHYEEKFEFELWTLIKERAERDDISYHKASQLVTPEFQKTIRYRDKEFEDAAIAKRRREMLELSELERTLDAIRKDEHGGA
ncbi:MAG: hypothetical protein ACYC6T_05050 [Thermoleophilia bacterium]